MKRPPLFESVAIAYLIGSFVLALIGRGAELAGFVAAGALAMAFLRLDSFKEFAGGGFSAKLRDRIETVERALEPITVKESEPEAVEVKPTDAERLLTDKQLSVLSAVVRSKFTWRTIRGIAKETSLLLAEVNEALFYLTSHNYVVAMGSGSTQHYGPTAVGQAVLAVEEVARWKP